MTVKRKRGRPTSSHDVSVTPEFKEMPDIEKLGRVLISVAISRSETKHDNEGADVTAKNFLVAKRKGDIMT